MRVAIEDWTIVMVGHWNTSIFTPAWLDRHDLASGAMEQETILSPYGATQQIAMGDLVLAPHADRLVVGHRAPSDAVLERGETLACRLLEMLPHTPVTAAGVNFGFLGETPVPERLAEALSGGDSAGLAGHGLKWRRTELRRTFELSEAVLNLSIRSSEANWGIRLNFHSQASDAMTARECLEGSVIRRRKYADDLLSKLYGLQCDKEDPDGG